MSTTALKNFKKGFSHGIPIGLGYLSVSFAFGMMAANGGVPIWATIAISMTNLTSAGQIAGLGLIISGGSLLEMALTQLVINMRYALMSLSLSQKFDKSVTFFHRLAIAFGNTDEIFAVSSSQPNEVGKHYMYGLIIMPYLGWTLGTALGAIAGNALPASICSALNIMIYGMFIAIFVPPAKKYTPVLKVVILAIILSCIFTYVPGLNSVSSGFVIIICTLISATLGAILFPIATDEEGGESCD